MVSQTSSFLVAAFFAIASITESKAFVIYTDSVDIIFRPFQRGILPYDLDNNGINDIEIGRVRSGFDVLLLEDSAVLSVLATPPNIGASAVAVGSGSLIGAVVGSGQSYFEGEIRAGFVVGSNLNTCFDVGCLGEFNDFDLAYIGVRFGIDGNTHFGWVEVKPFIGGLTGGTITGYAYETEPGKGIVAGAIPEPSVVALSVFAAVGALFRRKKKELKNFESARD